MHAIATPTPTQEMGKRWAGWVAGALTAVPLFAFFLWLGSTRYSPATWLAALPVVYLAASLLYRYEDHLPAWLSRALDIAAESVPTIAWLRKRTDVVAANTMLVDDLRGTLHEYGLGEVPGAVASGASGWGRQLTVRAIAGMVAPELSRPLPADVVELLHRERFGLPTLTLWQTVRHRHLPELAAVAWHSERVPTPSANYPFARSGEVPLLLGAMRNFDVDLLARELRHLRGLADMRARAVGHFTRHGLPAGAAGAAGLAAHVRAINGLPVDSATMSRIEDPGFALRVLGATDGSTAPASVRLVHLGAFLGDQERHADVLLTRLCHRATTTPWPSSSGPDPIAVLHGFLWQRQQLSLRGRVVTLADVAAGWSDWELAAAAALGEDEHEAEHADLRSQLDAGTWPTGRGPHGTFLTETAPSHDEVKAGDAYLITFDERAGPVADLVDCLTGDAYTAQLSELGVDLEHRGRRTYRFGSFTKNTRLGVLPPGMPFHEFQETFAKDMELVLRNRTALLPGIWLPSVPRSTTVVPHGGHRQIELKAPTRSNVTFRLTGPDPADPLRTIHGRCAAPPVALDGRRAVVEYIADPAGPRPQVLDDEVRYEYDLPVAGTRTATRPIVIHPKGRRELRQFEITLDRVDLAHCRELWFGGPALGPLARPPSICNVWKTISPWLDEDERLLLKPLFDRAAGGPGCS